jgi:hypothetical protein
VVHFIQASENIVHNLAMRKLQQSLPIDERWIDGGISFRIMIYVEVTTIIILMNKGNFVWCAVWTPPLPRGIYRKTDLQTQPL